MVPDSEGAQCRTVCRVGLVVCLDSHCLVAFVEIVQFVSKQGGRALGHAVLAHLFVRTLGRGKRGNEGRPLDHRPRLEQEMESTFRSAANRTQKSG